VSGWHARLEELGGRYGLGEGQVAGLARLLELVRDDPMAPTTVRDPVAAVDAHVADSLVALELDAVRSARRMADLGSGAGFPGLPLAVARPAARLALLESASRKCAFLRRAASTAGAENAAVVCERAESWTERDLDVVCVRAVAPLAVLVEYAAPLLRLGGTLVAWKGHTDVPERRAGASAASVIGLEAGEIVDVRPFGAAEHRTLHLYSKVSETPSRFPRRPGMARKRPLSR
jgi:16S rRNA (guanine527-N7)-methyltransferase